jgi:8-oxo-dGTP pyrophosphatase MutT (NUDIX family)
MITQMEKEYVDVIDEKGHILGTCSKDEAHAKGHLHYTVISEIKTSKGEWILVKQAASRQDANQFVSPVGGHVRSGESLEDALRREAFEEAGLRNIRFSYIGQGIFNRNVLGRIENHLFVLYEIYSDDHPKLNHESVGFERFTTKDLKEELKDNPEKFGDAFHFVVKHFFPQLQTE